MKLYTEEQVRKAIELSRDTHQEGRAYMERDEYDYSIDEVVDLLTQIELPTDDEIEKMSIEYFNDAEGREYEKVFYKIGAKWMRDKIQGGKKWATINKVA